MEVGRASLNPQVSAESAQLVKTLLEKHRRGVLKEQVENSPQGDERNITWITCRDFTVEVGKTQIGEYILTWELQPCWLYSVDFLYSAEEDHHTFYHYRARFSTPSPRRPIQGIASVYFVVGISKFKPQTLPVEVLFLVESNRLVHTPGWTRFREKWLMDVIESKTLLQRAVDF
ncbi:A-kinase anchor protein 14 [Xyrichtys novacula]|uniref:A-kinase anchor protein 14 n=1 Tax=Xyrichtys novacula TaxID=13765 RepID=A0AAV1F1U3_XYRNO|nr:A-kinase anchor protein 14 [Xyrichtys novacula]